MDIVFKEAEWRIGSLSLHYMESYCSLSFLSLLEEFIPFIMQKVFLTLATIQKRAITAI